MVGLAKNDHKNNPGCPGLAMTIAMIRKSERPLDVSSVSDRVWDLVNCTAGNRTCLPCDLPHIKCG